MKEHNKKVIAEFLRTFLPALTHTYQYTSSHQLAVSSRKTAFGHLSNVFSGEMKVLSIKIIDNKVVANEEAVEDAIYVGRFVDYFTSRGIQFMGIQRDIPFDELTAFIEYLNSIGPQGASDEAWHFQHIQIGKVALDLSAEEGAGETDAVEEELIEEEHDDEALRHFEEIFKKDTDLMLDIYDAVKTRHDLPISEIGHVVSDIITAVRQESSLLMSFSPLRALDEYTFTHSTNVCILTIAQAMAIGIKDEALHDVGVAAMLHDIGKIFVPVEILNKSGKLDDAEWALIRQHPQKGAEYLVDKPDIPRLAVIAAFEHHMSYDFSGYPAVGSDWKQNMCSQMVTISDFFDSLRTKRAYRGSVETKEIAGMMAGMAGKALNPALTKNFLFLVEKLLVEINGASGPAI